MATYNPVLMLVFNRPDTTLKVFEAIRAAKPPELYIASDGARKTKAGEIQAVDEVRKICSQVDWPCIVKTRYLEENQGCRVAVSGALDWFFEQVEQGIVIEDDVLPTPAFFEFCDEMLEKYKDDPKVFSVVGNNLVEPWYQAEHSYFFSRVFFVWGWASWRRAWKFYDVNMNTWPNTVKELNKSPIMPVNKIDRIYWNLVFDLTYTRQIGTCWGHQWTYAHWANNALAVTPATNLITNLGFGVGATHTSGGMPTYMKRLKTTDVFQSGDIRPEIKDDEHYYDAMSRIVLGIAPITLFRLWLRRFPALFSKLKKLSNLYREWRASA